MLVACPRYTGPRIQLSKLLRSRGCAPARRLHFFVRPKKRSKEIRPASLPTVAFGNGGFPPFCFVLQRRKKLAALKHFSSKPCRTGSGLGISVIVLIDDFNDRRVVRLMAKRGNAVEKNLYIKI